MQKKWSSYLNAGQSYTDFHKTIMEYLKFPMLFPISTLKIFECKDNKVTTLDILLQSVRNIV